MPEPRRKTREGRTLHLKLSQGENPQRGQMHRCRRGRGAAKYTTSKRPAKTKNNFVVVSFGGNLEQQQQPKKKKIGTKRALAHPFEEDLVYESQPNNFISGMGYVNFLPAQVARI